MYSLRQPKSTAHSQSIQIKQLDETSCAQWDAYVDAHTEGSFFHLSPWKKVFKDFFHFSTLYLYASNESDVLGILPLVRVKSVLFGDALISLPFCVYAGVVSDSPLVTKALIDAAIENAMELGVDYIELRQKEVNDIPGFEQNLYVSFQKQLLPDIESNYLSIPRKQRAMIRKGESYGLSCQINHDVALFYSIYSESLRNLGTPVHAMQYYCYLASCFSERMNILTVFHKDQALSSVMSFYYKSCAMPYYGGCLKAARSVSANDYMYWKLMSHSLANNLERFDFGRSKIQSGAYQFKKNWGFESQKLHYKIIPINSHKMPNINPNNKTYKPFIKMWQKLPLFCANRLGPFLARRIG